MSANPMPHPLTTPSLPPGYELCVGYPAVQSYLHLRAASGLTPMTPAQAAPVATGSWYGCYITSSITSTPSFDPLSSPERIGMARIISEGGWYFTIADVAVLPEHQRKGFGDVLIKELLARIRQRVAELGDGSKPCVRLLADPPGRRLYARNGFVESMPAEMGMSLPWND